MMRFLFSSHSKVCRRIFLIFLGCALLPTLTLALLYYWQVSNLLSDQAQQGLCYASKNIGERLDSHIRQLSKNLQGLAHLYQGHPDHFEAFFSGTDLLQDHLLSGLSVFESDGTPVPLLGAALEPPTLTDDDKSLLFAGRILLHIPERATEQGAARILIALQPGNPSTGLMIGEISRSHLLELTTPFLPDKAQIFVTAGTGTAVFSSAPLEKSNYVPPQPDILEADHHQHYGSKGDFIASNWSIVFPPAISSENWIVVVRESRADALASLYRFRNAFYLVGLVSFLIVSILSGRHIRRNLVPLQRLKEGTHRISQGDFGHRIEVNSRDEFENLADSLNDMAEKLDRQFHTLAQTGQATRALLSALDREKIIVTLLEKMPRVVRCDFVSLALSSPDKSCFQVRTGFDPDGHDDASATSYQASLTSDQIELLYNAEESLFTSDAADFSELLEPVARRGMLSFFILPIYRHSSICGLITLGYRNKPQLSREDGIRARSIADQVAVALANTRLMEELAELSFGTLKALARTVDAKSSWTAGHSERVTELAMAIGRTLGLPPQELDLLHRASLLHDIGKIGVPNALLEKAGPLTDREYALVKTHPEKGVRILEPIRAYRDVLPIVEQHHEWFNGQGYPQGLKGDEIAPGARILAVADVYDALISDRPYRSGWPHPEVIMHIKNRAGQQFDPEVVHAFLHSLDTLPLAETFAPKALQG